jgi:hypothetical protein
VRQAEAAGEALPTDQTVTTASRPMASPFAQRGSGSSAVPSAGGSPRFSTRLQNPSGRIASQGTTESSVKSPSRKKSLMCRCSPMKQTTATMRAAPFFQGRKSSSGPNSSSTRVA